MTSFIHKLPVAYKKYLHLYRNDTIGSPLWTHRLGKVENELHTLYTNIPLSFVRRNLIEKLLPWLLCKEFCFPSVSYHTRGFVLPYQFKSKMIFMFWIWLFESTFLYIETAPRGHKATQTRHQRESIFSSKKRLRLGADVIQYSGEIMGTQTVFRKIIWVTSGTVGPTLFELYYCRAEGWAQSPWHARQMLYHWEPLAPEYCH